MLTSLYFFALLELLLPVVFVGAGVDAFDVFAGEVVYSTKDARSGQHSAGLAPHCRDGLHLMRALSTRDETVVLHQDRIDNQDAGLEAAIH